jgi:hypothetical protein
MDLALEIASCAKEVLLSHHNPEPIKTVFPKNVRQTPDISKMSENTITFKDGSSAEVDVIFYCTGNYCKLDYDNRNSIKIIDNYH